MSGFDHEPIERGLFLHLETDELIECWDPSLLAQFRECLYLKEVTGDTEWEAKYERQQTNH